MAHYDKCQTILILRDNLNIEQERDNLNIEQYRNNSLLNNRDYLIALVKK